MSKSVTLVFLEVSQKAFHVEEVAILYVLETISVKIKSTIKILVSKLQKRSSSKRYRVLHQNKLIKIDVCQAMSDPDGTVLQRLS